MSKAHVSVVAQHDCALLGLTVVAAATLTRDAQLAVQRDVQQPGSPWEGHLAEAQIVAPR